MGALRDQTALNIRERGGRRKHGEGGPCLALGGAFVLERYGETRCVP